MATDAFQQNWIRVYGYANPPWNLIGRVLTTVERQEAEIVQLVPVWPSRPWYHKLLNLLVLLPLTTTNEGFNAGVSGRLPPRGQPPSSRVAYLRQYYSSKNLSTEFEASNLLLSSWRQKSSQSYNSLCKKWIGWCSEQIPFQDLSRK